MPKKTNINNLMSYKCPLCISASKFFIEDEKRQYFLCTCCSMIFVPPDFFLPEQREIDRYLEHENSLEKQYKPTCNEIQVIIDERCIIGSSRISNWSGSSPNRARSSRNRALSRPRTLRAARCLQ